MLRCVEKEGIEGDMDSFENDFESFRSKKYVVTLADLPDTHTLI